MLLGREVPREMVMDKKSLIRETAFVQREEKVAAVVVVTAVVLEAVFDLKENRRLVVMASLRHLKSQQMVMGPSVLVPLKGLRSQVTIVMGKDEP